MDEDSVAWDDAFSVGFALIDDQHKELVAMTNELFNGCKRGAIAADISFIKTIRKAVEYAKTHFATEEDYMGRVNYPDLDAHKEFHSQFVTQVAGALKEFEGGSTAPIHMARFLKEWLLNHIAVADKKYAPYLESFK